MVKVIKVPLDPELATKAINQAIQELEDAGAEDITVQDMQGERAILTYGGDISGHTIPDP